MFDLITIPLVAAVFGGLGYYVGQRGWKGVKNDLNDIKTDVQNLKTKLNA